MTMIRAALLVLALAVPSGALAQQTDILLEDNTSPRPPVVQTAQAGPAIDITGRRSDDPSVNVKELSEAAQKRQDDLREASERFILARIADQEKLNEKRAEHAEIIDALRSDTSALLRAAESKRLDDLIALRSSYEARLAEAEANRINAIRAVDVNAVQNATERAVEQASVLAQQLDRADETQRTLVSTTEQSLAASQRQIAAEFSNRLTALEQSQSFGQGRQTVSDPALVMLAEEVKKLAAAQSTSIGQDTGSAATIAYIFAGIGALVGLLGIGAFLWKMAQSANGNGNGNGNGYPPPYNRRQKAAG